MQRMQNFGSRFHVLKAPDISNTLKGKLVRIVGVQGITINKFLLKIIRGFRFKRV